LKWFHGEKDDEKNVIENKEFWETQCVCTVCSEKMVMEDVHLKNQAGEHEGEWMMRLVKNSSKVLKGVYHNSLAT
jgi:hypothetical protein